MNDFILLPDFIISFFKQFETRVYRPTKVLKLPENKHVKDWFDANQIDFVKSRAILVILKLTNYQNPVIWPKCRYCGNPIRAEKISRYTHKLIEYCSSQCVWADTKHRREKYIQTCLEKYGTVHPMQTGAVQKKRAQSCIDKYGTAYPMQLPEIQQKQREVVKQKYGVEYFAQCEEGQQKMRQTCLERYDVEHFSKTDEFKQKCIQTNLKHCGHAWFIQTQEARQSLALKQQEMYSNSAYLTKLHFKKKSMFYDTNVNRLKQKRITLATSFDEYTSTSMNRYKCDVCGHEWTSEQTNPQSVYCPKCHASKESQKEISVYEFVATLSDNVQRNVRSIIGRQELDIFIPSKRVAIEFNGNYWHDIQRRQLSSNYHMEKTRMCLDKNIKLLHIFEYDWDHKQELCKQWIKRFMDIDIIHVKDCDVATCDVDEANMFIDKTCLNKQPRCTKTAFKLTVSNTIIALCYKVEDQWYFIENPHYYIDDPLHILAKIGVNDIAINQGFVSSLQYPNYHITHWIKPDLQLITNNKIAITEEKHTLRLYNSGYAVLKSNDKSLR